MQPEKEMAKDEAVLHPTFSFLKTIEISIYKPEEHLHGRLIVIIFDHVPILFPHLPAMFL